MVVKKKKKIEPTPLGLILVADASHEVGGIRSEFKKGEELKSDTPANIVVHLKKIGVAKPKEEAGVSEGKEDATVGDEQSAKSMKEDDNAE